MIPSKIVLQNLCLAQIFVRKNLQRYCLYMSLHVQCLHVMLEDTVVQKTTIVSRLLLIQRFMLHLLYAIVFLFCCCVA